MYIVRVSRLLPKHGLFITDLRQNVFVAGAVVALLAALVSFAISRFISKPIEEIRVGAERYARGELEYTLPVHGTDEMKTLSRAMNAMAAQLDDRLRTVIRQRNEQQAILSSLVEGVLAVNAQEQIISMNEAAEKLLGINEQNAKGRTIQEVIRNSDLQTLVQRTLSEKEPTEGMIVLENAGEKYFQGYTAILHDSEGEMFGALVVLNDLTRIRKLENLRKDFVANVSHELKTPITTIKGFVETLVDGAISRPEESKRFLDIIAKQVDRLSGIIDDLLSLSWIEEEAGKGKMEMVPHSLREVLNICIEACEITRKQKEINIVLECPEQLSVNMNAPLLEQAIINLIDNAIKYSDNKKTVTVTARQTERGVTIAVTDEGSGIAAEHLPRLFERFYRVDKARSRKLGGTGLGLSIVKHIVLAHGGTVDVTSRVGVGTTFTVHLPAHLQING
jgi:two-component system phosphate regulon sensor histidine kinase PhoR